MPDFQFAKQFIGEKALGQLLGYLGRDTDANVSKLLHLAERLVPVPYHKEMIANLREAYATNPVASYYVNRVTKEFHPNIRQRLVYNFFFNSMFFGIPKQRKMSEQLGINVPHTILIDPTSACNLRCTGCWAGEYRKHDSLPREVLDRILVEAKELGIYWIVMSGGEPFLYPHLLDLAAKHSDMVFMLYTNGTLISDAVADRLVEVGNVSPAISLEGDRERTDARRGQGVFDKVMAAMDRLRQRGVPFGVSLTLTSENVYEVTADAFIDFLIEKGVAYGWSFHYIPIGRDPDVRLMVTPEQRAYLVDRIHTIRTQKPFLIADFWNDGELTEGCIAGGRRYFHITASGTVEPCAFVHFSVDNILDKSLREVLNSPLFRAYQKRQPFSENLLTPCPLIDVPQALRDIVSESGAKATHPGAETALGGPIADFLDQRSAAWAAKSKPIWEKRQAQASTTSQSAAGPNAASLPTGTNGR